jgi:hypothetical protein
MNGYIFGVNYKTKVGTKSIILGHQWNKVGACIKKRVKEKIDKEGIEEGFKPDGGSRS